MEGYRTISMSILAQNHSLFRSGTILYLPANTFMVLFWTYMSLIYTSKERSRRSKICQRTSHRWWSECIYCFHGSSAQFGWCVEYKAVRGSVGIGWSATEGRLTAVEVDADQVLNDFRSMFEAFDVQKLADALQPGLLQDLGLGDFENLLSNPPFERIGLSRERIIQCCHCGCSTNWLHKWLYDELRSQGECCCQYKVYTSKFRNENVWHRGSV